MNIFQKLYQKLKAKHGRPQGQWRLWCKRPKTEREREEVIIGAILTQRTNWRNVELAIKQLKQNKINRLKDFYQAYLQRRAWLEKLLRPSGFYKQKASYLFELTKFILEKYQRIRKMKKYPLSVLRNELLSLKGIGPETADSILLYALDKPTFVIDEYTRRLVKRKGLQELFEKNLKKDFRLYQDFHALIVINGKNKDL